jgi:predicted metal-dependent enzyme (double-stranded beta helix superfamily)
MTLLSPTRTRPGLAGLVDEVRAAVDRHPDWGRAAALVADALRRRLPGPDLLTAEERAGDPTTYQSHLLHVQPDGAFSILAVVWRPGQVTPIHDHVTWCVVGVVQGVEHEELFGCPTGEYLVRRGDSANPAGSVTGFAPPGDIHRVHNPTDRTTISLHVYGTDISRIGSSVRRVYDLPIRSG